MNCYISGFQIARSYKMVVITIAITSSDKVSNTVCTSLGSLYRPIATINQILQVLLFETLFPFAMLHSKPRVPINFPQRSRVPEPPPWCPLRVRYEYNVYAGKFQKEALEQPVKSLTGSMKFKCVPRVRRGRRRAN